MQAMQGQQDSGCWRWRSWVSKVEEGQVKSQRVLKGKKNLLETQNCHEKKPQKTQNIYFLI